MISLDSAHEPVVVRCDQLIYSSGINPVENEPRPRPTPIIIAKRKPMKPRHEVETQKQKALRAPAKDPCQAWPSSWAAGLEDALVVDARIKEAMDILW